MKYLISIAILITIVSSLNVPKCSSGNVPVLKFYYQNGTGDSTTVAKVCYDDVNLNIEWLNIDKEVISTYTKCNDPLYKEDAV